MTMDLDGLEHAIVRHCSPALVGIKPSCLFNVPGDFSGRSTSARRMRAQLDELVGRTNRGLARAGVHVRVLARRRCGALVLVYRPQLLAAQLASPSVSGALRTWGYVTSGPGWLDAALSRLGSELEGCQRRDAGEEFPHEVGFFLGYPYEDVMGFIEHEGRDYLCCGCWKVYSQRERAEACFARYRRCTRTCELMLEHGAALSDLAGLAA